MAEAGHLAARLAENRSRFPDSQPELVRVLLLTLGGKPQHPTSAIDQIDIDRLLASFE